jgi:hypothetical protein
MGLFGMNYKTLSSGFCNRGEIFILRTQTVL